MADKVKITENTEHNRFTSRKFLSLVVVWLTSLVLGFTMPDFVGNAQVLFNFWTLLLGLYFGGNVAERYTNRKTK